MEPERSTADAADTAVGRTKLSIGDRSHAERAPSKRSQADADEERRDVESDEGETDEAEDGVYPRDGIILLSASNESPVLVPLPEPPAPSPVPSEALPPPRKRPRDEGADSLPAPLVPFTDAGCSRCATSAAMAADVLSVGPGIPTADDHFGMGSRQVPFALFHVDSVEPLSQIRLRADFANGLGTPDRAERYWAAPPVGPSKPERNVDLTTFSVYSETGGDHFSAFTEVPLVAMRADVNGDTTGLGNLVVGQKFLLTNPKNRHWQIAQILRTYLPTGTARRGLGNGLTALEPGLLVRYRLSDQTYFHGEIKYWIPFGGDPQFAGRVSQYGVGASTVLWQSDDRAILGALELIGSTIGDGRATLLNGTTKAVNSDTFLSILPGVRMTLGPSGDLGLFEVGVSGGVTVGDPGWYDSRVLLDFRWSF